MRKSLVGAAGTAVVVTGLSAAIAVGQTADYNEPLPAPGKSAQKARNAVHKKLSTRAAGRALRAGKSVTVTITDAAPGSYTVAITRGGTTGTVSGTVEKQKKTATKIAGGKKTLAGTTTATLKLKVKASKKGLRVLRRTKAKKLKTVEKLTYKRSGSSSKVSKRKLTLKLK